MYLSNYVVKFLKLKKKLTTFKNAMIQKIKSNNGWKGIFANNIIFEVHI